MYIPVLCRALAKLALLSLTATAALLTTTASPAHAVYYRVPNYAADTFVRDGRCSLREALWAIRYRLPTDTCPAGDQYWNEVEIISDPAQAVELTLSDTIEINSYVTLYSQPGPGFYQAIHGKKTRFVVLPGGTLEVAGLKFSQFNVTPILVKSGFVSGQGFLRGTFTLSGGEIASNMPTGFDQTVGIANEGGQVNLYSVSIHHNISAIKGGAIFNKAGGLVTMSSVAMYENEVSQYGGAIHNIGAGSKVSLFNCTISGNSAGIAGGGIYNGDGATDIQWTTITGNDSETGPGVNVSSGTLTVQRSIIADNFGQDCSGTVTSGGYNLLRSCPGATAGTGDIKKKNAELQALTEPNGTTWTQTAHHVPQSYSPAVNAIPIAACNGGPDDQILKRRPIGSACDMGSIERQ